MGDDFEDVTNQEQLKSKLLGIIQDIIFLTSRGRKASPKHIGLGVTVHQLTRSKGLVQLLHSAGHSIINKQVLQADTSMAMNTQIMNKMAML